MKNFLKQNWRILFSAFVLVFIGTGRAEYFVSKLDRNFFSLLFPSIAYGLLLASIFGLILQFLAWIKNKKILTNSCLLAAAFAENIFLLLLPFFPPSGSKEIGYGIFVLCSIFVIFLLLLQIFIWFILAIKNLIPHLKQKSK